MLVAAIQSSYSMACQPVDYSDDPRALRVHVYFHLKKIYIPKGLESRANQLFFNMPWTFHYTAFMSLCLRLMGSSDSPYFIKSIKVE